MKELLAECVKVIPVEPGQSKSQVIGNQIESYYQKLSLGIHGEVPFRRGRGKYVILCGPEISTVEQCLFNHIVRDGLHYDLRILPKDGI
jgi:hypothetical protein